MSSEINDNIYSIKKIIKIIKKTYDNIDFSLLPNCIEEKYKSQKFLDKIFLFKLIPALEYYDNFKNTYHQKTSKNVYIQEPLDLVIYMVNNSEVVLDDELTEEINFFNFISSFSNNTISIFETETLMNTIHEEKQNLLKNFIKDINESYQNALKEREKIKKIETFIKVFGPNLSKQIIYVNINYESSEEIVLNLFNLLSIEDKFEIAWFLMDSKNDPKEKKIDLEKKSAHFIATLKYLDTNIVIPKSLTYIHPLLMFMNGNEFDITNNILGDFLILDSEDIKNKIKSYIFFMTGTLDWRVDGYKEKFTNIRKKCIRRLIQINETISRSLDEKFFKMTNLI